MADLRLFVNRVFGVAGGIDPPNYFVVDTMEKLKKLKKVLSMTKEVDLDVETHSDYFRSEGRLISLSATCVVEHKGKEKLFVFALPLYHPESPWRKRHRKVLLFLKDELEAIPKVVAHNAPYDIKWMRAYGIMMLPTFCTLLAMHVLNENVQKGLKPQAQARLGVEPWGIDTKDLLTTPLDQILEYNVLDTWYMYWVRQQLVAELKKEPRKLRLFMKLLMPGQRDLILSEMRGIYIDVERLKERKPIAVEKLLHIEQEIMKLAGLEEGPEFVPGWPMTGKKTLKPREPNFNASIFAKWMLFEHCQLPVLERGKDKPNGDPGDPSMREGVLLELKNTHPVVPAMLKRVEWQKAISSFFNPYEELYDEEHRIHTNFKLAGTVTGRLSSGKDDPDKITGSRNKRRGVNLQQVPRDPFIRGLFGAPPGWSFVEADYSQIELRIVAFLSRCPTMLHLYKTGADIHLATASNVLGVPESQVTKDDRKKAKAVNFGFVYGMGWRKFIQTAFEKYELHFTEQEARDVRTAFFDHFPGLQPWHARQRRLVNQYGRVQSPLGRVRHLPDIFSPEEGVRAEAERQAINSPVQSFGSDLAVLSMVEINKKFEKYNIKGNCVGLVHDAINFEIRDDYVKKALPIIKDTMEDASIVRHKFGVHIDVPIIADLKIGTHWGDAHELTPEQVYDFVA
jgi:DNA polymerase-1